MAKVLNMKDIDGQKLKRLVDENGGASAVARKLYKTPSCVINTIGRERISPTMVEALWDAFGIPFEAYAKRPETETQLSMDGDTDKIITLLEVMNNRLALILSAIREGK